MVGGGNWGANVGSGIDQINSIDCFTLYKTKELRPSFCGKGNTASTVVLIWRLLLRCIIVGRPDVQYREREHCGRVVGGIWYPGPGGGTL